MRPTTALILASALALGLAACGKKGAPYPPEGQEEAYTYPRPYPAPETLVPGGGVPRPSAEEKEGGRTTGRRTSTTVTTPTN
jgi:hypothetical protein